jgi:hypothetical protein
VTIRDGLRGWFRFLLVAALMVGALAEVWADTPFDHEFRLGVLALLFASIITLFILAFVARDARTVCCAQYHWCGPVSLSVALNAAPASTKSASAVAAIVSAELQQSGTPCSTRPHCLIPGKRAAYFLPA